MMRNRAKKALMRKLQNMGVIDNMTAVLAQAERELLTTAKRLEDAHGRDTIGEVPTVEDRQKDLNALIEALMTGDFRDLWIENVAPELLDTTDGVDNYLGMDADEWERQITRWAESYRDGGAEGGDRALAAHHVAGKWGVDLDTFEDRVINWDRGEEAERLFAGNFRAVRDVMDRAADDAGGGSGE
ncbi:hypothetical protein [Halobaculum sp. EA56]|uniref:hypothetical protein n=1 Tax=Halobaculum sp. EA56 TaxID=3421648 RepID=UPI003EBEDA30